MSFLGIELRGSDGPCHAEVTDLDGAGAGYENIRGLDVSVHYVGFVKVTDGQ